jgi:ribosomal protein L11 methylase PrmA
MSLNPDAAVELRVGDVRSCALPACDIVLANLTGALLVAIAGRLEALVNRAGLLVLSGFLGDEEPVVLRAFSNCALERLSSEDEWGCATLRQQRSV